MRIKLTIPMLSQNDTVLYEAVLATAKLEDFKFMVISQMKGDTYSLNSSLRTLYEKDPSFNKRIIDYVNDDKNYSPIVTNLIANRTYFRNIIAPTRNADFAVTDETQEVYFWIEERLELTLNTKINQIYVAKLMVDDKSDSLLFHNGQDSWVEYSSQVTRHHRLGQQDAVKEKDFATKVAEKYKEFLAEQQLLKD